ncbi:MULTISPECIES: type VI secretion system baseplate subunit TssF [unclassified Cedecea]|uniref:type VI secretion system baseplate subunit TssF n=1 Tax=unclassified Cedecea TaxID=2649846 RepID=UPI0030195D06
MNKLLSYYQKELRFLKEHGKVFAYRFPKIARRLGFVEGESEDPHISRLIESFALLTSRIHQRLDDDIPEVVDALLNTLAPQFLRTLPSTCIVTITPDTLRSGITDKNRFDAGTSLFTRQSPELPYQFQTIYPVTLLPLSVNEAKLSFDSDALSWKLQLLFQVWPGAKLANERVRIYLHGPVNAVNTLYTLLCSEVERLFLRQNDISISLEPHVLSSVGFDAGEALLTPDPRIAPIHILLMDYFWFPQKFSFIDIQLPDGFSVQGNGVFELQAVIKRNALTERLEKLAELVDKNFFRLNCTPAINLFPQRAEPITLTNSQPDYPIVPDARHQNQIHVWAVHQVSLQRKVNNSIEHLPVQPLLESHVASANEQDAGLSWQVLRRELPTGNSLELKHFIAFCEHKTRQPSESPEIITINTTCTNYALPHQLQYGHHEGDFDSSAPIAGLKITCLTHPTSPISPLEKSALRWRFLSQLSLNHQLLDGAHGAQRLKDMLALYNIAGDTEKARLVNMIKHLSCEPVTARLISNDPHSLARGISISLTFCHDALGEPDYYLLCCLLDRLLALYAPVNSFTRLTTVIEQEAQTTRIWPVRAGRLSWL